VQRQAIARFAAAKGHEVVVEIETGKGADALDRRPQLAAARRPESQGAEAGPAVPRRAISRLMTQPVPFIVAEFGRDVDPFV
jgi:hypothetical protein